MQRTQPLELNLLLGSPLALWAGRSQRVHHLLNHAWRPGSIEEPGKQRIYARQARLLAGSHLLGEGQQEGAQDLDPRQGLLGRSHALQQGGQSRKLRRQPLDQQRGLLG
jgi:hypothetical protein